MPSTQMSNTDSKLPADIVFIVAEPATGKTFTGDYLELVHGYTHVDGDYPIFHTHIPKYRDLAASLLSMGLDNARTNSDGPEEQWKPYFEDMVDRTLEAAKHSEKVVLTFAAFRQAYRDFVVEKLIEGGAKEPKVLYLTIDSDARLESMYLREKEAADISGLSLEDRLQTIGRKGTSKVTEENYKEAIEETFLVFPFESSPKGSLVVDVTVRSAALGKVCASLGLPQKSNGWSHDELVEQMQAVQKKRFLEAIGSIEEEIDLVKEHSTCQSKKLAETNCLADTRRQSLVEA